MSRTSALLYKSLLVDLSSIIDVDAPGWCVDSNDREVACYRLRDSLVKKFNDEPRPSDLACSRALHKFLGVNERVGNFEFKINYEYEAEILGLVKNEIHSFWEGGHNRGRFLLEDLNDIFMSGRSGPGASLFARGQDFYSKFYTSPHSCSSRLSDVWSFLIRRNQGFWFDQGQDFQVREVNHNKLGFVNKNVDIARTTCTEPFANMWMQLGIGSLIEDRLAEMWGINLSTQPDMNRAMALDASFSGQFSTIDLESASDSLSLKMLKELLPPKFWWFLEFTRSEGCLLPNQQIVPLQMVGTMGNGYTFPLQTMLFCSVVRAVYRYLDIKIQSHGKASSRNHAVFGDDIIVLAGKATRLTVQILGLLGFVVNSTKSFVEGPFRESCGVDGYNGINVRPVYIKRLKTVQDRFVAINRLAVWCAVHNVRLPHVFKVLLHNTPKSAVVPLDENDDAGLKMPFCLAHPSMVRGAVGLYRYTKSKPVPVGWRVTDDGPRGAMAPRFTSFRGLERAFIGGYIRGDRVTTRQWDTQYKTKRCVTPRWDYVPPQPFVPILGHNGVRRLVSVWTDIVVPG